LKSASRRILDNISLTSTIEIDVDIDIESLCLEYCLTGTRKFPVEINLVPLNHRNILWKHLFGKNISDWKNLMK
jgi:hypothetical protein